MAPNEAELRIRRRLVEALQADLVGPFVPEDQPGGGAEILPLPPSRWYLTGFLAPQGGRAPELDDGDSQPGGLAGDDDVPSEDAGEAEPEPKRPTRFPASMGLSVFLPPGEGDHIEVDVDFADYDKVEVAEDHEDKKRPGWQRVPHRERGVVVPLDRAVLEGRDGVVVPNTAGLRLRGELRTTDIDGLPAGARVLSLFLVNERPAQSDDELGGGGRDRDQAFVFQVRLSLRYSGGFLSRPNRRGESTDDDDQRVLALNFRDKVEWAVGHNTSVVRPSPDDDGRVRTLTTTQLPEYEVFPVEHVELEDVVTDMRTLAKLDGDGLERALTPLVERYGAWIDDCRYQPLDRAGLEQTRDQLMTRAARARDRMREGIGLLRDDDEVRAAFCLANQAMHVAAVQADKAREDRRYRDGRQPAWRPFQLGFVLLNLASVADPAHADRNTADLIYFPTGGGKTEAYLGLVAFALLLRRLRGKARPDQGRGVAVILRYTLRLLTLDQLGRAAALMCALEEMRRRDPKRLGNGRFAVGLWVGQSATANRLSDVHKALHDYSPGRQSSPFPLSTCPWCNADIKIQNVKLVDDTGKPSKTKYTRAVVYCDHPQCLFTEAKRPGQGLPVLFVDEQIYCEVPDFIVATVDKYAMVPWRGEAGMLFGRATHIDEQRAYGVMHKPPKGATRLPEGLRPPELVIQDELHLISGPLGTMVGLYEAAVDYLCERELDGDRRGPKVVCSTATVRRAREQIRAIFGRRCEIFPPRGVDHDDNFFSTVNRDRPGRLYVGVAGPGRALRAVSVRTYATLLAAAQKHFDPAGAPAQPADPYMTLVGYFNSLRELGGMRRLVEDEVRTRVAGFDDKRPHELVGPHPWAAGRQLKLPAELTSRESTERVKETKRRLGARRSQHEPEPLDVVLASNMISVGLDVDRLGLMVVTGQPKTTSEYIQSTSRVGRKYPGLVVTCLNLFRPRDRSHYERFVSYHESFYRDVEATTVTPFSGQTLDRGLVGTLLTMVRHGVAELEPPTGVQRFRDHRDRAEAILEWLVRRARHHREQGKEAEGRIADLVRRRGRDFFDSWVKVVDSARAGGADRVYSALDHVKHEGKALMYTATDDPPVDHDAQQFEAPTSMRDVEPSVHVWLSQKSLDQR
ncbi:DISARM system helicase DrmA [Haliangium sp.]|uniref:DISARM system helicase DrmA n=1 Tax=Haliangium sp. TaxID=2663208 RepID=UPI003D0B8464